MITGKTAYGPTNELVAPNGLTWKDAEFGTAIVRLPGGRYGVVGDAIFSIGSSEQNSIPKDTQADFAGIVHNHPGASEYAGSGYSDAYANFISYPSYYADGSGDWAALETYKNSIMGISSTSDPSLWVIDPRGIVREFKLSEKDQFTGLTRDQKYAGVGLAGRERSDSCN